jgi:hypothetical protein
MTDTPAILYLVTATGAPPYTGVATPLLAEGDGSSPPNYAFQSIPRVNSAPVSTINPMPTTANPAAIGNAVAPFTVTPSDAPISGLTLPGKMRLTYPAYQIANGTTAQVGQVLVNYVGGNSLSAPTAALLPGTIDDWIYISGTVAPHVSNPQGSVTILIQQ